MSFLLFFEGSPKPKTRTWSVAPQTDPRDRLGEIRWYGPWRKYCFFPSDCVLFDTACLRELADFCEARTREHKESSAPAAAVHPSEVNP
jgi:hypothetical protein